jgi:excisionase family DNA binding protein
LDLHQREEPLKRTGFVSLARSTKSNINAINLGLPTQLFEPLLNSREAAALLHMHHKTLERKARSGEIPGYQIAGRWYFRATELDAWLRTQLKSASANLVRVN